MNVVKQGFTLKYEILEVGSIKPGESGVMNGRSYNASVKFRSSNVIEKMNEVVGLQEVETNIEYKIPCSTAEEAKQVNELVRKLRSAKSPIYINGDVPKQYEKSLSTVDSFDMGDVFIKLNSSTDSKNEKK